MIPREKLPPRLCPLSSTHIKSEHVKSSFEIFCDDNVPNKSKNLFQLNFETPSSATLKTAQELIILYLEDVDHQPLDSSTVMPLSRTNKDLCPVFTDENSSEKQKGKTATINYVANVEDEDEEFAHPIGPESEVSTNTPLPLIIPVNLQDTPLEPENKENQPPKDYESPKECRFLSGILTPATNVPVQQHQNDDSDFDDSGSRVSENH